MTGAMRGLTMDARRRHHLMRAVIGYLVSVPMVRPATFAMVGLFVTLLLETSHQIRGGGPYLQATYANSPSVDSG